MTHFVSSFPLSSIHGVGARCEGSQLGMTRHHDGDICCLYSLYCTWHCLCNNKNEPAAVMPRSWIMRAIWLILIYTKLKRPYHGCASLSIYLLSSDCSFSLSACDCSVTWESCPPLLPLWWHTSFRQLCGSALEFYRVFVSSFWVTMATFTHTLKKRLSKSLLWSCPKQNIVVEARD